MHFIRSSLVTIGLVASVASALSPRAGFCYKLPSIIKNIDMDKVAKVLVEEGCNQGCSPKISEFDSKLRDVAVPIIQAETTNMGAPELHKPYTVLLDLIHQTTRECADEKVLEAGMCHDIDQTKSVTECLRNRAWSLVLTNPGALAKLSTTRCQEQYDFWSDPNLPEKIVPYARRFVADGC